MTNWYNHRDAMKRALNLPASSTGDHFNLDTALEAGSRLIDDWLGYHLYSAIETRHFTARDTQRLSLRQPLTSIVAIRTDYGGDGSYETTWSTTDYRLWPYEATAESPPRPYWDIELRQNASVAFPEGVDAGVEIAAAFGRFDIRTTSTATLSTGLSATGARLEVAGSTALHPGQTIRIDNEDMFVEANGKSGSDTATTSGSVTVLRAQNGSSAATHSSGSAIQIFTYPLADRAALYQAEHDFKRALADPAAGGDPFGREGMGDYSRTEGDLHPAVRRMLRSWRTPVIR